MSRHRVSTGLLIVMTAALWLGQSYGQRVGIGTANPEPRAILHLESDSMGFLPPRLTQQERDAIPTALRTPGLMIYNKTTNCMEFWNGSQWVGLCGGTAPCSSNPPLAITPTASPSPACAGQNITLSAPSFTSVNYIWIGPNNYFATGQNVVISSAQPSHSGTYCVKVYAGPCLFAEGCVNVTVNPAVVIEQKATFPGSQRAGSSGFVIGDSLYVIQGGDVGNPCCSPVSGSYAYDVVNDAWRTITDPSTTRSIRAAFSLEGRGYIVGGHPYWADECFRYNPTTNS